MQGSTPLTAAASAARPAQATTASQDAPAGRPRTSAELEGLIARRAELARQLESVTERRGTLAEQRARGDEATRSELTSRIRGLDDRAGRLETEIRGADDAIADGFARGLGSDLQTAVPSIPPIPSIPPFPPNAFTFEQHQFPGMFSEEQLATAMFLEAVGFSLIGFLLYRRLRRSMAKKFERVAVAPEAGKIDQLQQAVDVIALEVERISEGQRFVTKLLSDRERSAIPSAVDRR